MKSEKFTYNLTLTDPKVIEIVEKIPEENRDQVIEKYIMLGDMVVSHASISTSKESVERFFEPLRTDINTIRDQLKHIVPTVMTPAKRGAVTEETIFNSFQEHFLDDSFEDVSGIGKYADILASIEDWNSPILIELKDYSGPIPSSEVEKFWRDMEFRDSKYGIFISLRTKITKISGCINLKHNLDRTAIFVVDAELNHRGHIFAFYIIKKLIELETLKKKDTPDLDIEKTLRKINDIIKTIQKLGNSLEEVSGTAETLKQRNIQTLDNISSTLRTLKIRFDEQIELVFSELKAVSE